MPYSSSSPVRFVPVVLAFTLVGSAGGWAGQEVWGPLSLGTCLVLGLAISALVGSQRRQDVEYSTARRIRVVIRGVLFGGLLFIAATALWAFNDVLLNSGGVAGWFGKSLLGAGLGLVVGLVVAWYVRPPQWRISRVVQSVTLAGWMGLFLTLATLYLARTGVRDPQRYPPRESSPYLLPWPGGVTRLCSQGNWAIITHRGHDAYAFDFPMPIGSPVCAARGGIVWRVIDHHDGNGTDKPGNGITIRHDDGTFALYWHIRQNGSLVEKGDCVKQGQQIAESGNVGYSTSPHLHFQVYNDSGTIPVSFRDVETFGGIPRMWLRYTSGNW